MIPRTSSFLVLALAAGPPAALQAQRPDALRASDLQVGPVAIDDDSAHVVHELGLPSSVDSSGFHYRDQVIWFHEGKVAIVTLTGSSLATPRGLRVGDSGREAARLYRPCYSDDRMLQICYRESEFDERAVIVHLEDGQVSRISLGRILDP